MCDEVRATAARQQGQLAHAQDYIRQIESELTERQHEVRQLRREVHVLRGQVERLRDEPSPSPEQGVPGAAMQVTVGVTRAAHRTTKGQGTEETRTLSFMSIPLEGVASFIPLLIPSRSDIREWASATALFLAPFLAPFLVALTVASGFAAGVQATPGPAVWKLVLYSVVALAALAITLILALSVGVLIVDEPDDVVVETGAPVVVGVVVACLFLGAGGAAKGWTWIDLLGHWFADSVGIL
ncbi:hypothetical protein ACIQI8_42355 [Streptomyces sp. NPDC092369]|uniref:hypothetical protein n=1 Tax=Streptomyces sp. NPDC092369 TaxID=3366015 RepID=UPI00380B18D9